MICPDWQYFFSPWFLITTPLCLVLSFRFVRYLDSKENSR